MSKSRTSGHLISPNKTFPNSPHTSSPLNTDNTFIPAARLQHLTHSLPGLREECWICQNLHTPENLVYYESRTSIAKLNPDQLFQGYTFLALKWHEEELHTLTDKDRKLFLEDMSHVASALAKALSPDKMNYELLGNAQPHLHWHIIPRYTNDPLWGRPIWAGNKRRKRLTTDEYSDLVNKIKQQLAIPAKTTQPPRAA